MKSPPVGLTRFELSHAAACPRCGASTRGTTVPWRATRVERAELSRLGERPQAERDAMALRGISTPRAEADPLALLWT